MLGFVLSSLLVLVPSSDKNLVISFDDAPRPEGPLLEGHERAKKINAALKKADAKAVFYIVGSGLLEQEGRDRVQLYSEAGHLIANHSFSHPKLSKTDVEKYLEEIRNTDHLISKYHGYRKWFRYPYLDEGDTTKKRDRVRQGLEDLGYINAYVTVDNADWYVDAQLKKAIESKQEVDMSKFKQYYLDHILASVEHYDALASKVLGRKPVQVLLLHENDSAALFLGDLLSELKKRGWSLVHPDSAYNDPLAAQVPNTLRNGNGRIFAIASSLKLSFEEIFNVEEKTAGLDRRFSGRQIAQ